MAADSIIATIVASKIPQLYPNTLSGAVNIETVIAPTETKKMIPKFTIPVYPVCKFREKAIKMKIESVSNTFDTWRTFLNSKLSDSAIGSQTRNITKIVTRMKNDIQDPIGLCLPYNFSSVLRLSGILSAFITGSVNLSEKSMAWDFNSPVLR